MALTSDSPMGDGTPLISFCTHGLRPSIPNSFEPQTWTLYPVAEAVAACVRPNSSRASTDNDSSFRQRQERIAHRPFTQSTRPVAASGLPRCVKWADVEEL